MALDALEEAYHPNTNVAVVIKALRAALAQPEKTDMQIGLTYEEANPHVHANDISKERVHKTQKNEHEPVAWRFHDKNMWCYVDHLTNLPQDKFEPLYTAPPKKEWVELTDDEYIQLLDKAEKDAPKTGSVFKNLWYAINTKLKEKNND